MHAAKSLLCISIAFLCSFAAGSVSRAQDVLLSKTLVDGPDPVGMGKLLPSEFVYVINLNDGFDPSSDVFDVVPAEFDVTALQASCGSATSKERTLTKKGNPFRNMFKMSPDFIMWDLEGCVSTIPATLTVTIRTDNNPGHGRRFLPFHEPTSCGPLFLNDGARLRGSDDDPEMVSNPLSVAACLDETDTIGCADADDDGWSVDCGDCNDEELSVNPGATELCFDGIDNDCDGEADEIEPEVCDDGIDNDCDGLIDADDEDCPIDVVP